MKEGAPLRAKAVPGKVRAFGPGLEPTGVVAKAPANFTVETFGAGDGDLAIKYVHFTAFFTSRNTPKQLRKLVAYCGNFFIKQNQSRIFNNSNM